MLILVTVLIEVLVRYIHPVFAAIFKLTVRF